jgi:hypothetical protein
MSMPIRLRSKKGTFLSKDEVIDKAILGWIIHQKIFYSSGYKNSKPMEEGRKIKFQASGLLR